MKNSWPTLSPLLRSDSQGLLLAALYLDPDRQWTLSELAKACGVSVASVMRDVDRLIETDFLLDRRVGRSRLVRVNDSHPLTRSLTEMLLYSYGPQVVIHNLTKDLPGVEQVLIFGSWAERLSGVPGHNPNDVDVLLIGEISMKSASEVGLRATEATGREVNVMSVSAQDWLAAESSLIKTISAGPMVTIHDFR